MGRGLSSFFDEHVHKNPQADKVLGGFYRCDTVDVKNGSMHC